MSSALGLYQIDSVKVLAPAHYLPALSPLGGYDRSLLGRDARGRPARAPPFEYWVDETSLLPLDIHPRMRWRIAKADRGEAGWKQPCVFAGQRRPVAMTLLERMSAEGLVGASDLASDRGKPGRWEWSETGQILE